MIYEIKLLKRKKIEKSIKYESHEAQIEAAKNRLSGDIGEVLYNYDWELLDSNNDNSILFKLNKDIEFNELTKKIEWLFCSDGSNYKYEFVNFKINILEDDK